MSVEPPASRQTSRPGLVRLVQSLATLGAVLAVLAEIKLAGGSTIGVLLFAAWVLLPFALTFQGVRASGASAGRVIGLGVASAFGLVLYLSLLLSAEMSSTAGLAIIFVPLWQLLGVGVVLRLTSRSKAQEAG